MKHLIHTRCEQPLPLADEIVHVMLTSIPYPSGARDYDVPSDYGHEKEISCMSNCGECYACHTFYWLQQLWPVMHPSGTVFINIPELYRRNVEVGLVEIVKRQVRAAGFSVVQTLPWLKTNGLPKRGRRPTARIEYVIMAAKTPGGNYYDQDANRVRPVTGTAPRLFSDIDAYALSAAELVNQVAAWATRMAALGDLHSNEDGAVVDLDGRVLGVVAGNNTNARTNSASFPRKLVRPLLAATLPRYTCPVCGGPYERVIERMVGDLVDRSQRSTTHVDGKSRQGTGSSTLSRDVHVIHKGWEKMCNCPAQPPVPGVFLDMFCGTGTAVEVAAEMGCMALGMDLSMPMLQENMRAWSMQPKRKVASSGDLDGMPLFSGLARQNRSAP